MGDSALLIIDVQNGLFERKIPIFKEESFLHNINQLEEQARSGQVPIIYVRHENISFLVKGTRGWELHFQLHPSIDDTFIGKTHSNAFEKTDLPKKLKEKNIKRLVIAGLVTHGCVQKTCLWAKELGYEVILVEDGHSNFQDQAEEVIKYWNQKLAHERIKIIPTEKIKF